MSDMMAEFRGNIPLQPVPMWVFLDEKSMECWPGLDRGRKVVVRMILV